MILYSAVLLIRGYLFLPFRTALPSRGQITWNLSDMYVYVQCSIEGYLSRLGPHSRLGANLLGIRVRYTFTYSAVLEGIYPV